MLSACSINNVILMGRLTSDPELRQTANGTSTCQITVAVNRNYSNQEGERPTDFITVVAWRQTAEFICRNFSKGKIILVEGELRSRTYDDKRYPEVRHYVTEVYANNVSFGETKASSDAHSGGYGNRGGNGYNNGGYGGNNYGGYGNGGSYGNGGGYGSGSYGGSQGGYRNNQQDSNPENYDNQYNNNQPQQSAGLGDFSDFEDVGSGDSSDGDLPF